MPFVRELLDSAPSAAIAELHSRRLGRSGIVQSSRIRSELEAWLSDPVRMEEFAAGNPAAAAALSRLAFAGRAGFAELDGADELSEALMAFRPVGDAAGWHGLDDWSALLRGRWLDEHAIAEPPARSDALPTSAAWVEGVAGLSAKIDLGLARLNRSGELNRRDRPVLRSCFFHLAHLPEDASETCLDLTLAFLAGREWVVSRNSRLECHEEMVEALSDAQDWIRWIRQWWLRLAIPGEDAWWRDVSCRVLSGADALRAWSWLDWVEPPADRDPAWKQLPSRLRQALALGLLEADLEDGLVVRIRPGEGELPAAAERPTTCTADFLVYLGPGAPPTLRRDLESMGIREQAGRVSRYRLVREAVLAMSASTLLGHRVQGAIDALDPPPSVRRALAEWMLARRTCQFESFRVLRVREPGRFQELSALPLVTGLVRETIPGWGFVVDPALEPELRRALATLGYDPPALEETVEPPTPWSLPDAIVPVEQPAYEEWHLSPRPDDDVRRNAVSSASKYGESLKELPFSDLLRVAEYAILVDAEVEAVLRGSGPKPVRFKILRLDKRREPVTLEIRSIGGREPREIPLESVRKIRVVD